MTRTTIASLFALSLLALAAPALGQDLQVECEVYRFADRSQTLAEGRPLAAAELRKRGRLRYQVRLPCLLGDLAEVSSSRRIPFTTQTVSQGVTQTSVQFMEIRDSLRVAVRASQDASPATVSLQLGLSDVAEGPTKPGLPPVSTRQEVRTIVALNEDQDVVLVQGGLDGSERVQVVIVRIVKAKSTPPARPR